MCKKNMNKKNYLFIQKENIKKYVLYNEISQVVTEVEVINGTTYRARYRKYKNRTYNSNWNEWLNINEHSYRVFFAYLTQNTYKASEFLLSFLK